jgi:hypothetical protein
MNALTTTSSYSSVVNFLLGPSAPSCGVYYSGLSRTPSLNYSPRCNLADGAALCNLGHTNYQRICCCGSSACSTTRIIPPSGWLLGDLGASCDATCAAGKCHAASMAAINSNAAMVAAVQWIDEIIAPTCATFWVRPEPQRTLLPSASNVCLNHNHPVVQHNFFGRASVVLLQPTRLPQHCSYNHNNNYNSHNNHVNNFDDPDSQDILHYQLSVQCLFG